MIQQIQRGLTMMGDDVVVVDGMRKRRKATREVLMKDLSVIFQEGSPFIVYSDVQESTAVTLTRGPFRFGRNQRKTLSQRSSVGKKIIE
jgi:hypothetical protein